MMVKVSRFWVKGATDIPNLYFSSSSTNFVNVSTIMVFEVSLHELFKHLFSNHFFFLFFDLSAILFIYLTQKLNYDEDSATIIFHLSAMAVYLCSLFGAILADSWWGKFKTILVLSCVYAIGSLTVSAGSVEQWKLPAKEFTITGLVLIALGSGGIKPCVAAFGGEQFKLPQQEKQLVKFFSIFYFVINAGSLISTFVTPLLRTTSCFGMEHCFVGGFGLPAVLMLIAIIVFVSGHSLYKKVPPQGNMIVKVCKCVGVSF
jgi:solute carrier family 15 (oligopeptide transporter), member 1